jgi:hypothetical protein
MPELDIFESPHMQQRLFDAPERWGWEFQDPGNPRAHKDLNRPPQLQEPAGPDIYDLQIILEQGKESAVKHGAIVGVVALIGLVSLGQSAVGIVFVLAALGLGAFWFWPMINASQQITERQSRHETERRQARQAHDTATRQWQSAIQKWDVAEQERIESAMLWYPLRPRSASARLEVFGGTPEGWSSFLVTLGAGVLSAGNRLLVLDLSEYDIGRELAMRAQARKLPVRRQELPAQLDQTLLLQGLTAEEVAEMIAEALHGRRGSGDVAARLVDADILKTVVERLEAPVTFVKLATALRTLQGVIDTESASPLSGAEIQRVAAYVDLVGGSERVVAQIQELRSTLDSLLIASTSSDAAPTPQQFGDSGLTLLVTNDANARRRDIVDRLVVQALVHRLRTNAAALSGSVVVIAGADHLGMETLDSLGRAARRADVRLFLLIEHLREEFEPFLGGSDSAAIFMRMGNAREAARAAEHIGRGHTFQMAQLSRQKGTTLTQGTSITHSTSETFSQTSGTSGGSSGRGWSDSQGISHGTSEQFGTNESVARSETDGVTHSRVYEFTVEPTRFQGLDPHSFILVQPLPTGGRRITAGTCDAQVVTLPRVSEAEFDDALRVSSTPIKTS